MAGVVQREVPYGQAVPPSFPWWWQWEVRQTTHALARVEAVPAGAPQLQVVQGYADADGALLPSLPERFRERVLSLHRPHNWDGERGRAIRESACRAAVELAAEALRRKPGLGLPRPSPSAEGAVALTWYAGDQSLTVLIASASQRHVRYLWNGPGYEYRTGEVPRSEVVSTILAL